METLYRKVTFEINDKDHDQIWLIGKNANFMFNPNTRNGEELSDFLAGCEEIPDNTSQLQADKAELLEALEDVKSEKKDLLMLLDDCKIVIDMTRQTHGFLGSSEQLYNKIESLIQKHKQCQENTPR